MVIGICDNVKMRKQIDPGEGAGRKTGRGNGVVETATRGRPLRNSSGFWRKEDLSTVTEMTRIMGMELNNYGTKRKGEQRVLQLKIFATKRSCENPEWN